MKYIIPSIILLFALVLSSLGVYCGVLGVTEHWTWFLVGIGLSLTATVAFLAASAGFSAVRSW